LNIEHRALIVEYSSVALFQNAQHSTACRQVGFQFSTLNEIDEA